MTRIIVETLTLKFRRVTRVINDKPSLPPMRAARVYDTTGEDVTEARLAKCVPFVRSLRRVG